MHASLQLVLRGKPANNWRGLCDLWQRFGRGSFTRPRTPSSPPFLPAVCGLGAAYFFAHDAAYVTRLLKFAGGALTVLARDGEMTAENDTLQNLGQFGLAVEAGKVFLPALTARGPGLYVLDGAGLQTVIPPGLNNFAGLHPVAFVLQDVAEDIIALMAADTAGNRRLVANLALLDNPP